MIRKREGSSSKKKRQKTERPTTEREARRWLLTSATKSDLYRWCTRHDVGPPRDTLDSLRSCVRDMLASLRQREFPQQISHLEFVRGDDAVLSPASGWSSALQMLRPRCDIVVQLSRRQNRRTIIPDTLYRFATRAKSTPGLLGPRLQHRLQLLAGRDASLWPPRRSALVQRRRRHHDPNTLEPVAGSLLSV
jgi:hypothetical protein